MTNIKLIRDYVQTQVGHTYREEWFKKALDLARGQMHQVDSKLSWENFIAVLGKNIILAYYRKIESGQVTK